jgi:1-deoxy-D-xylulose 5-phosphate reductoisomerase
MSLGGGEKSEMVEQAIEECVQNGIACIVAAGNSGGPVQYPASSPSVLAVAAIGQLNFVAPDLARYPALAQARAVMQRRGLMGAVFNAAKERALDHFIAGRIRFTDMAEITARVLDQVETQSGLIDSAMTLDNVTQIDHIARKAADVAAAQSIG